MKSIYNILTYDGPVHALRRWLQELLVYSFTCLHRPNSMMADVDALSRRYDPLVAEYTAFAAMYRTTDTRTRPAAYCDTAFTELLAANRYTIKRHSTADV